MVRLITQFRVIRVLLAMIAVSQLVACGSGGGSNTAAGGLTQVNTGTAQPADITLSWTAPVMRADGSPMSLADIDGYHIYYGTSTGNYTGSVDVTDGTKTSVTITGLSNSTYHLAMTTYDVNGLESGYSPEILKTAQ